MNMSQTEAGKEGKLESSDELRRKRTLTPVQWSTLYKCKYKYKHKYKHNHKYKYKYKYKYKSGKWKAGCSFADLRGA